MCQLIIKETPRCYNLEDVLKLGLGLDWTSRVLDYCTVAKEDPRPFDQPRLPDAALPEVTLSAFHKDACWDQSQTHSH